MAHQLSLKLGLHLYRSSQYFNTNDAFFNEIDLTSSAGELEYDYLWFSPSTLGLAIGYYDGQTRFKKICCSKITFSTRYALWTLKFPILLKPVGQTPVQLYAGPGMGYYLFDREVTVLGVRDSFSEKIFGYHFLVGVRSELSSRLSLLAEARYASVAIRSANELNDKLNIGGVTALFGISWKFPDFAHILPTRPPEIPEERVTAPPEKPLEKIPAPGIPAPEIPAPKVPEVKVPEAEVGLKDVHFDYDQAIIREDERGVLENNAKWLLAHPDVKVIIEGHCDERGTNEYNLALGEKRANAVKQVLIALGIDENRTSIISYGEEKPICFEKTDECFAKNRRVHFALR